MWKADETGIPDPFLAEAERVFPGLDYKDSIPLPGYGTVSLADGAAAIRAIYDDYLNRGWVDYAARDGYPALPAALKNVPPETSNEMR